MKEVGETQPQDLHVFKNYVDAAIVQNFFTNEDLKTNFSSLADLLQTYALNAEFDEDATVLKFLVLLKGKLAENENLSPDLQKNLIGIIWTLIARETSITQAKGNLLTSESNPLIPRLLEHLYSYKPGRDLSRLEYLQLFQINLWINEKLEEKRLPEVFANCIPQSVLEKAEDRFSEYDRSRYENVQTDVAKRLLDIRVTFKENQKLNKVYRADIKLLDENLVLLLKTGDQYQRQERKAGAIPGIEKMRSFWLQNADDFMIKPIDVDNWKTLSQIEKLKLLTNLTKSRKDKLMKY